MGRVLISAYEIIVPERKGHLTEEFSAVVLADLHNQVYRSTPEKLLTAVRRVRPSLALVAGDMVLAKGNRYETDTAYEILREAADICPVYLANGNHESRMRRRVDSNEQYVSYEKRLRDCGVEIVNNRSVSFDMNGVRMSVSGLELPKEYYRRMKNTPLRAEDLRKRLGVPDEGRYNILLAHHPKYFDAYADWGADLTLSGHLHGGIVRLPGIGGVVSPDPGLFPRYDHGRYRKTVGSRTRQMIVSSGLGTHTINLRVNNPAELVVLHFTGGGKAWRSN